MSTSAGHIGLIAALAVSVAFGARSPNQENSVLYTENFRAQYHFSPVSGWLGDPDGMVHYKGIYHVFWWGHAESKDLVHWKQMPYPMDGDGSFDYYSGSVVVDKQNTSGLAVVPSQPPMVAMFTMHPYTAGDETQALSVSQDYTYFYLYQHNPVLTSDKPGMRDPQVWWDADNKRWLMVIALADDRKVSFYTSPDLKSWTHLSDFGPVGARTNVWEVPDLFRLPVDGDPARSKWVLLTGMGPNREQYFIGDFDGTKFTLDPAANGYLLRGEGLPGTVFADFEHGLQDGWKVDGRPISIGNGDDLGFYKITGYLGAGFLSTFPPSSYSGDPGKVIITSPTFTIDHNAINFLISGGAYSPHTGVNLLLNGKVVRTAGGDDATQMKWVGWDVSEFRNAQAQIQVVDDQVGGGEGHINIDQIMFSDVLMPTGREQANWLDYGPDYYAVRTYRDYDNVDSRVITMGWLGNWEYAQVVPTSWGRGTLALPRELTLHSYAGGVRLFQQPIAAFADLRQSAVQVRQFNVSGTAPIPYFQPSRNTYELDATFQITDPVARFGFTLAANGDKGIKIGYDGRTSNLFIDRMHTENDSFSSQFPKYVTAPISLQDGTLRLHIFVDQSSVEVFANDGEVSISTLMFPDPRSTAISLFSEGGNATLKSLLAWPLTSIWGIDAQQM